MNAKMLFKIVFVMVILLLLVMMGMNNRSSVSFVLPPLLAKPVSLPAAIMYFACFAIGVLTGSVLSAGGGKKGGGASAAKSGKGDK